MKEIVATVCITVVWMYALYKYWQWKNPYTDEPTDITANIRGGTGNNIVEYVQIYKRTWKSGKVEYVEKRIKA